MLTNVNLKLFLFYENVIWATRKELAQTDKIREHFYILKNAISYFNFNVISGVNFISKLSLNFLKPVKLYFKMYIEVVIKVILTIFGD